MNIVLASASPRRRVLLKRICEDFEIVTADVDERAVEERILNSFLEKNKIELPDVNVELSHPDIHVTPDRPDMREAARQICMELALQKARAVFEKLGQPEDTVVIGADTSVALPDEILGKPLDRDDAVRMLRKESLEPQYVVTGVALIKACKAVDSERAGVSIETSSEQASEHRNNALLQAGDMKGCCLRGDILVRQFAEESLVVFNPLDEKQEQKIQRYCNTDEPYDKAGAYGLQDNARSLVHHYEGDFSNIVGFPVDAVQAELDRFCKI